MQERIEFSVAGRPKPGERESGDRCVVTRSRHGAIFAVIDGVGHGPLAAHAAATAANVIENSGHESIGELMSICHEKLRDTRGAAVTLVALDLDACVLQWVGAGNVMAVLLRVEHSGRLRCHELFIRGGIVGAELPSVSSSTMDIARGDTIIIATDGINFDPENGVYRAEAPQAFADRLLKEYQLTHDDALVVVVRVGESCR